MMGIFSKKISCEDFGGEMALSAYHRSTHAMKVFLHRFFGDAVASDAEAEKHRSAIFQVTMIAAITELMLRSGPEWTIDRQRQGVMDLLFSFKEHGVGADRVMSITRKVRDIVDNNNLFTRTGMWGEEGDKLSASGVLLPLVTLVFKEAHGDLPDRLADILGDQQNLTIVGYDMVMASQDIQKLSSNFRIK